MSEQKAIGLIDEFIGYSKFPSFILGLIEDVGAREILDVGGGAQPVAELCSAEGLDIHYTILDIDPNELEKNKKGTWSTICVDATAPRQTFLEAMDGRTYDLIFSRMFLEHIRDPDSLHANLAAVVRPGGYVVHVYPTRTNIPLFANWVLPEAWSRRLVRFAMPSRHIEGLEGKFPAYYKRCGVPSASMRTYFEKLGYTVERHRGFAGHGYYNRFPVLRRMEELFRPVPVALQIPWVSYCEVILRKK